MTLLNFRRCSSFVVAGSLCLFGSTGLAETLEEAVTKVIDTNPQVMTQVHNKLARMEEIRQARAGYLPTLDVEGALGIAEYEEPDLGSREPWEARISLRQNLFRGLATMNEVGRQEERTKSAAYRLQSVSENLALQTTRAYLDVLRREEIKVLADENLQTHLRIADQVELRSKSGVGSQADSEQVGGRLSLAQSNVVITQTNLIDAQTNYLAVVGHMPGDLTKPDAPEGWMPPTMEDAEAVAVEEHPTLKSANADLEARKRQDEVAKSPYYPVVDLELDQNWEEDVGTVEGEEFYFQGYVRARWNLFNGFADQARKAETKELISEAREIRNNTQRQVVESLRLSWMAYQAVLDRLVFVQQNVDSTRATAESYAKQFDLGRRTLLDLLDTEAEHIQARRDLIEATYDGLYAQYRILNSMGRLVNTLGLEWPEESIVEEE